MYQDIFDTLRNSAVITAVVVVSFITLARLFF